MIVRPREQSDPAGRRTHAPLAPRALLANPPAADGNARVRFGWSTVGSGALGSGALVAVPFRPLRLRARVQGGEDAGGDCAEDVRPAQPAEGDAPAGAAGGR